MAFNSDTYRAGKHRAAAWENLARARALRAEGELPRAALYAKIAMSDMRLALNYAACAKRARRP